MEYHNPVLLKETVDGLNIRPDGIYVDVTFGGGGHSREIMSRLGPGGKLFAFDQDLDALKNAIDDDRFMLINENFRFIKRFSTRFEAELDMRMDQKGEVSAYNVVNEYDEQEISRVLFNYGELKNARAMASVIVAARQDAPIKNSEKLKEVLARFLPAHKSNKILAQIYQAIRIEVNQEMDVLKEFLEQSLEILKPGGRLSVISYHSLEDRLVKRFVKNGMFEGEPERDFFGNFEVPFKTIEKLIVPSDEEIALNNRARSAKLRVAEKK